MQFYSLKLFRFGLSTSQVKFLWTSNWRILGIFIHVDIPTFEIEQSISSGTWTHHCDEAQSETLWLLHVCKDFTVLCSMFCWTMHVVYLRILLKQIWVPTDMSFHPASRPPDSRKFHFARATKKPCSVFLHIAAQVMVHMLIYNHCTTRLSIQHYSKIASELAYCYTFIQKMHVKH